LALLSGKGLSLGSSLEMEIVSYYRRFFYLYYLPLPTPLPVDAEFFNMFSLK
jgi:hypothetical protein